MEHSWNSRVAPRLRDAWRWTQRCWLKRKQAVKESHDTRLSTSTDHLLMYWDGDLNRPAAAADLLTCMCSCSPFNLLFLYHALSNCLYWSVQGVCTVAGCLCTRNERVYKVRVLSAFLFRSIPFCLRLSGWKSMRMWVCVSGEVNVFAEQGSTQQERAREPSITEMIHIEMNTQKDEHRRTRSSRLQAFWRILSWLVLVPAGCFLYVPVKL